MGCGVHVYVYCMCGEEKEKGPISHIDQCRRLRRVGRRDTLVSNPVRCERQRKRKVLVRLSRYY